MSDAREAAYRTSKWLTLADNGDKELAFKDGYDAGLAAGQARVDELEGERDRLHYVTGQAVAARKDCDAMAEILDEALSILFGNNADKDPIMARRWKGDKWRMDVDGHSRSFETALEAWRSIKALKEVSDVED